MAGGLLSSLHSLDGMFPTVYMELIELLGLPCDLQVGPRPLPTSPHCDQGKEPVITATDNSPGLL